VLRGSFSQGFRAPTLNELFSKNIGFQDGLVDTLRFDVTGADEDGGGTQYRILSGGNPDLNPEESTSYYGGFVYAPKCLKGLSVYTDYTHIRVTDVIQADDPQRLLNLPLAQQAGIIIRNPPSASDVALGIPGTIITINQRYRNLSSRTVDAIDFGGSYDLPTDSLGTFTLAADTTYFISWREKYQPGAGDFTSQYAGNFDIPEWRLTSSCFWNYKKFSFGPTFNYISSYEDSFIGIDVGDWWTIDLQATYMWPWDLTTTVGVLNVTGNKPPFSSQNTEGYDTVVHSNVGAFWYLRVTKKF
jgi:iron complex outermembrane receptor protein